MIGIVMLNYNGWDMTVDCLRSIEKTCYQLYKVYIVDNASNIPMSEKIIKYLSENDRCELIKNNYNKGYAAGNNIGIEKALKDECEYVLIANNDIVFKQRSIDNLISFMDNNKGIGITGPKVYLKNGGIQEINMGCKMTISGKYLYLLRKTFLKRFSKKFTDKFHCVDKNLQEPFEVFAVSGCCFVMTNKVAHLLFPLDENTFLYEEENIIGCKMEELGLKTVYCTNSEIIHLGGGSTNNMSEWAYLHFIKSEQYYCKAYLHANIIQRFPLYLLRKIMQIRMYGLHKINLPN